MDKVRWGLLSTARINRRVIPALKSSARGELVAVASRSKPTAEAYAREWEIPYAFGSYQEMLAADVIDAVYIGLPNHLHAEWSIAAMQAGKHVLCEKPLAISMEEVERMIATSQETGRRLAEAFMYRHHPQTKIIGDWAHSGRLGDLLLVRGVFNFQIEDRENIRLVPKYGGGCLWDVGIYPVSLAQFIMGGPPLAVSGVQWLGPSQVDETFSGLLRYAGDRAAQIASAFNSPLFTQAEIIGTEGRLTIPKPFAGLEEDNQVVFTPTNGTPQVLDIPAEYLYNGEVEDMHAAILDGSPNTVTLDESRQHIGTVLALYQAARQGQVIEL